MRLYLAAAVIMRRIAAASALVVPLTAPASAAYVEFSGSVCLTAITSACQPDGWSVRTF